MIYILLAVCLLAYLVDAFGLIKYQTTEPTQKGVSQWLELLFDVCRFVFWISYICLAVQIIDITKKLPIELFAVLNLIIMFLTPFMAEENIKWNRNLRCIIGLLGLLTAIGLL